MTESDWNRTTDPQAMLAFLRERGASERKLRLFAVACCRKLGHLLAGKPYEMVVDVAERYCDGEAELAELVVAGGEAELVGHLPRTWP